MVIRSSAGHLLVAVDGTIWRCQMRGRLKRGKRQSQTVAVVGDRVRIGAQDPHAEPPRGVLEEVLPRTNRISRMAARRTGGHVEQVLMANLDQVVAVQSIAEPRPQTGFVDRLLVAAERFGVAGVLVLNKADLPEPADQKTMWDYFVSMGYKVLRTSAETGQGGPQLADLLKDRVSLLIGASGVGKSSLLNLVEPGLRLRVGEVTGKTGLGRHTTTSTELFPLAGGGFIADSPGIRGFDPWAIAPRDVRDYFPDFAEPQQACRFRTCLHRDEPVCGVKEAVAKGRIPRWRLAAYLSLLGDLEERAERLGPRKRP